MNITGREWAWEEPNRLFISGFFWGTSITGLWFFYITIVSALNQIYMVPFLNKVKTQALYGFWASLLFLVLLLLVYTDARIFSGRATEWWSYIGRFSFIITVLINVSAFFWALWFLTEPGTPSLTFLYESDLWEWSVRRIRKLTYIATPWYASYYLRGEYGLNRTKIYATLVLPFFGLLGLSWFLTSNTQQIALNVTGIFGSVSAMIPVLLFVYRDLEGENEIPEPNDGGILRKLVLRKQILFMASGLAIGLFLSQGFVLMRFPIGGNDILFPIIKYVTLWLPILLLLCLQSLRI